MLFVLILFPLCVIKRKMKEIPEDRCEQEVSVEDVKSDNLVSKWVKRTILAVGIALVSCSASSLPGSSKPETQMPKKKEETSPYSRESVQEIQRLYVGLGRRMYVAYHYGKLYRRSKDPRDKQVCFRALAEAKRFFRIMIMPRRFRNKKIDSAMRVVKEQTKVRLKLLENNCKLKASAIFNF